MIGVSNSTLAHYESEYRAITLENLKMIADACGFEILFRNKEKTKFINLMILIPFIILE